MSDSKDTTVFDYILKCDKLAVELIEKYKTVIEMIAKELISGKEFSGEEFTKKLDEYCDF